MRILPVDLPAAEIPGFFRSPPDAVVLVSRHGLGDNVFFSPCLPILRERIPNLYFCSSVNAYTSIFHESPFATPLYAGGTNGNGLGLGDARGFAAHFQRVGLPVAHSEIHVYHFGLFEPPLPISHPQAFVKGRRNLVEVFGEGPSPLDVPRYCLAPDPRSREFVERTVHDWLPGRELICIARYGHTGARKNFGHTHGDSLATIARIDRAFPGRFKYVSLDYTAGRETLDGRAGNVRSVYGFLPCDTSSLFHLLGTAKMLVTVPTGPMLVGSCIPGLKLLTLWKDTYLKPFHFLDPQFDEPAYALVETERQESMDFAAGWDPREREALARRWVVRRRKITPESVADFACSIL